jgi:hypothetical protein
MVATEDRTRPLDLPLTQEPEPEEVPDSGYWEWLCPLWRVEGEYNDSTDRTEFELVPCREVLHLVVEGSYGVDEELNPANPGGAFVARWNVECEGGHTVLHGSYGDESDAPYDPAYLEGIGAQKVPGR